jgi:hypothetical protein
MADINLDSLASDAGSAAEAAARLADGMNAAAQSSTDTSAALGGLKNYLNSALQRVGEYGGSIALLALRTTSLTSSVYGADKAFTSVVPTLEKMGEGLERLSSLARVLPNINVAGKAAATAIAGTSMVFNKLAGVLRFQLEAAQKVADAFVSLNQNGAAFGYSIQEMQIRATRAGVPLQTLARVVQANIEPLSQLGMGVQDASLNVTSLARDIIDNARNVRGAGRNYNMAVTASYGNMENLSAGIANYLQLQTQLGENVKDSSVMERIRTGEVQEYLLRQKELTALTGKNAAQLKKEEEERRKNYLYAQALNKMSPEQRANTEEQMAMLRMINPALHDAAMEIVSFGDVMTPAGQQFQAMNQEAVQFARQGLAMTNADRTTFRRNLGNLGREFAPIIRSVYENQQDVIQSGMIGQNRLLQDMGATASGFLSFNSMLENSENVFAQMEADRLRAAESAMDPSTRAFVDATRMLIANQVEIDQQITQNMQKMTGLISSLNYIQTTLLRIQGRISDLILTTFEQSREDPIGAFGEAFSRAASSLVDVINNPREFRERPAVSIEEEDRQWADLQRRNREALDIIRGRAPQPAIPRPATVPGTTPVPNAPPAGQASTPESSAVPSSTQSPATPATPTATPISSTAAPATVARMNQTFESLLTAIDSNNTISTEQRELLTDILRVQQNILDAVA